jgi:hypothetical protein
MAQKGTKSTKNYFKIFQKKILMRFLRILEAIIKL